MIEVISVGISFPKRVLTKIDSERGDISRSRYLLRVIENALQSKEKEEEEKAKNCDNKKIHGNHQDLVDSRSRSLQPTESGNFS
jgi:metal-responsive CopG/Arc/MetJ family transcriptional regulator